MRFTVLVIPGNTDYEAGAMPDEQTIAEMMQFNEEIAAAGVLLAGDGLHPTARGARVQRSGGKPVVTDGPFTEAKEVIGGYWIWQVNSREEAIEWATRHPLEEGDILELRQVFEMSDFEIDAESELGAQVERVTALESRNVARSARD